MGKKSIPPLVVIFIFVGLPVLVIDQLSKYWAQTNLQRGQKINLFGDWFSLELVHNPGAAFSLAANHTWIFTIVAFAVAACIAWLGQRVIDMQWQIALGMLAGGAVGNLVDRLVQPPGFMSGRVVDFLNYKNWFVGNIADIAIVFAVLWIIVLVLRNVPATQAELNKQQAEAQAAAEEEEVADEEEDADEGRTTADEGSADERAASDPDPADPAADERACKQ